MNRQVDVKALVSHIIRGDGLDKCRICMGETTLGQVHLGDTVMMDGDMSVTLSELLELITGVTIEWTPCLPSRLCQACSSSVAAFIPFFVLCRDSAYRWDQTANDLSMVSVNKQATTAYVLLGDESQTLADRSTTINKTPKDVMKNIRLRMNYLRYVRKHAKNKIIEKTKTKKGLRRSKYFSCPDCNKGGFKKLYQFNFHLNTNKKHCCPHCFTIINIAEFGKHLASHKKPSFECDICHLHFDNKPRLLKHEAFHTRGKFTCPDCKYTFLTMDGLSVHTTFVHTTIRCACDKIFHGQGCYLVHKKRLCPKKRTQKYVCDYCSKEFKLKCILKQHINNCHLTLFKAEQCDKCGKTFRSKAHLKEHGLVHDKVPDRFSCEYCGKQYSSSRGFMKHMTKIHYEVNPELYRKKTYPCEVCNKILTSETNLKNHISRQHRGHGTIPNTENDSA